MNDQTDNNRMSKLSRQTLDRWFEYRTEQARLWVRNQWRNPVDAAAKERWRQYTVSFQIDSVKAAVRTMADEAFEFAETLSGFPDKLEVTKAKLIEASFDLDSEIDRAVSSEEEAQGRPYNHKRMASIKNIARHYIDEVYKVAVLKARFEEIRSVSQDTAKTRARDLPKRIVGKGSSDQRQPSISVPALEKWWNSVGRERRESMSIEDLLAEARAANSNRYISRERIRELAGPRKRGPKGFSGKRPAK